MKPAATHLLDISVYSQPLRPRPLRSVTERWRSVGDENLVVSVVCEAEVLRGLYELGSQRIWAFYQDLLQGRLPILPVDHKVADVYARLGADTKRSGQTRAPFDLLIAATAKTHGLIVATCNAKHFEGLEGLAVEDWSVAAGSL